MWPMSLATLRDRLLLQEDLNFLLTNRVPRIAMTRFMGWFSKIRHPWVCRASIAVWRLFTELDLSDAKQQHFSELIYRSATTLLDVINDILDYSKIEAGKLTLEQIDFDPRDLFEDVADVVEAAVDARGVREDGDAGAAEAGEEEPELGEAIEAQLHEPRS